MTSAPGDLENDTPRKASTVRRFLREHDIGRTTFYSEIKAGRLAAVKVGRRTLVPLDAAERWLRSLPQVRP